MSNGNENGPTKEASSAAAASNNNSKREVRIQFLCEKRQVDKREEVPTGLIGQDAARSPHMRAMFERTMRPIVMRHAAEALDACEAKCSSKGCERDATTIVATPMSVSLGNSSLSPPPHPYSLPTPPPKTHTHTHTHSPNLYP